MKYKAKEVLLKNGKKILLRSPEVEDAQKMLLYLSTTAMESDYMVRMPEECRNDLKEEEVWLENMIKNQRQGMIVADHENQIIGSVSYAPVLDRIKIKHRAGLGIALFKEYQGIGLGSILMEEVLCEIKKAGFEQVELEVVSKNEKAIQLYQKFGFEKVGCIPHGFKLKNGQYMDLIMMVRKMEEENENI